MFSALIDRQPWHPEIEIWENRALSLAEGSSNLTLKFQTLFTEVTLPGEHRRLPKIAAGPELLEEDDSIPEVFPFKSNIVRLFRGLSIIIMTGSHEKCLKAVSAALELSRTTGIHTLILVVLLQGV